MQYQCHCCGRLYHLDSAAYKCECGGLFDIEAAPGGLDLAAAQASGINSLWRYRAALPFGDEPQLIDILSLGEGNTPLLRFNDDYPQLLLKADYYMPTLSFKDRGAVMLVALAKQLNVPALVADSSGNAGTAIAAYAARAGIACHVFVPATTSEKKLKQIFAYGAVLHAIPGSREDTARAAIRMVETEELFYASHIFNPFFHQGTKTYVYEVFEQLGELPDDFIIPTGNGTLLLGVYRALCELLQQGLISALPRLLAVQAKNCAPIYRAFRAGESETPEVPNTGTAAEGIAIAAPARGSQILEAVRATNGQVLAVDEAEILAAQQEMAAGGISVEITSAANFAAYRQLVDADAAFAQRRVVLPLCGAGLKSL